MGEENDTFKNIILFLVYAPTTILALILVYFIVQSIIQWSNTGSPPEMIRYIGFYLKEIFLMLSKPIIQILKFINYIIPIPWKKNGVWEMMGGEAWSPRMRFVSLMIVLLFIYLTISIAFVMDGTPTSLKIYSDAISYVLMGGGILLALGFFLLYVGKSSGQLVSSGFKNDGGWLLSKSKPYLLKAILAGLVIGALGFITKYFFADSLNSVNLLYITIFLASVGLMFFVYSMLSENKVFQNFLGNNIIFSLLYNLVFIIPCVFFETAKYLYMHMKHTPKIVYVGLMVEVVVVFLYIILPMLKNHLYVMMPLKDDKLSSIDENIEISQLEIDDLKSRNIKLKSFKPENGFALNQDMWNKLKKNNYDMGMDNNGKLDNELINYGYKDVKSCRKNNEEDDTSFNECMKPLIEMREYIKSNLSTIIVNEIRINTLQKQITDMKSKKNDLTELDNAIIIQNKPIYINKETVPITNKLIPNNNDYRYNYTLSLWFFITHRSGEHGYKYNKYATIIDYNMNPKVSFNNNTGKLKIEMNSGGDGEKMCVAQYLTEIPMQKWNNLVINYDGGIVDVFINGVLKKSLKSILPALSYNSIKLGEIDGIAGGVCNVVYYPSRISQDRIIMNYNLLKNNNPPTI